MDKVTKADILELKSFANPPKYVKFVIDALSILFDNTEDWTSQRKLLSDPNFINHMKNYDIKNVDSKKLAKLKPIIECRDMSVAFIMKSSKAAASLFEWVLHIYNQALATQA